MSPRNNCDQASRAISAIVNSYSQLYTLKRTPSFISYFVLASTTVDLAEVHHDESNTSSKERLFQNMADLMGMTSSHGFANQALDAVRYLRSAWGVDDRFEDAGGIHNPSEETLSSMKHLVPIIGGVVRDSESQTSAASSIQGASFVNIGMDLEKNGFRRLPDHEGVGSLPRK